VIKLIEQIERPGGKHEELVYIEGSLQPGNSVKKIN
jgi:hypothetical protein